MTPSNRDFVTCFQILRCDEGRWGITESRFGTMLKQNVQQCFFKKVTDSQDENIDLLINSVKNGDRDDKSQVWYMTKLLLPIGWVCRRVDSCHEVLPCRKFSRDGN